MQQTEKYKLNLIESSDPFLPDGLNENTRKLEQVVSQHLEGMDQRISVFEAKKFVYGTYKGTGQRVDIQLGFTPIAVIIGISAAFEHVGILVKDGAPILGGGNIVEGGFFISHARLIDLGANYNYIAFG